MCASELQESFKNYYEENLKHWTALHLFEEESILSQMIDSDFVHESILFDDVCLLYELVRNECVRRVGMISQSFED